MASPRARERRWTWSIWLSWPVDPVQVRPWLMVVGSDVSNSLYRCRPVRNDRGWSSILIVSARAFLVLVEIVLRARHRRPGTARHL
jgi:hypothetical protein